MPFLFPLRHRVWERAYVGAGVPLYDTIGGARALPRHRHVSRRKALQLAPSLRPGVLTGAVRYYDAQMDDARLAMMVARTASQHGATVLTRAEVVALRRDGAAVTGAQIHDLESGAEITLRARVVISATGVWTGQIHQLAGVPGPFRVQMSKGVHLLVPRERIRLATGLITRTDKSVLFVIPRDRHWIIGTTDTPFDQDRDHPTANRADVEYLLDHVNALLTNPITTDDIVGVYAGLRSLLAGHSSETTRLSREHAVAEPTPGLFVIAGGKYTTYRVMAADVVDAAARTLGRAVAPSLTDRLPIFGAVGFHEIWAERHRVAADAGLPLAAVERLLHRYGSAVTDLLALIEEDASLADPIPGAAAYLRVEALYAATHEGALHIEDVLVRRTRAAIETPDPGPGRRAARCRPAGRAPGLGRRHATGRDRTVRAPGGGRAE